MTQRLQKFFNKLSRLWEKRQYILEATRFIYRCRPQLFILWIILTIIQSILPIFNVFLIQIFVDILTDRDVSALIPVTFALVLVTLAQQFIGTIGERVYQIIQAVANDDLQLTITEKRLKVDLEMVESYAFQDFVTVMQAQSAMLPIQIVKHLGTLVKHTLTLLGTLGILFNYAIWLPPLLLISGLPLYWVAVHRAHTYSKWHKENASLSRKREYFVWLTRQQQTAQEMRLFRLDRYFIPQLKWLFGHLTQTMLTITGRNMLLEGLSSLISMAVLGLLLLWMLSQYLTGLLTLGGIAAFYQVMKLGQSSFNAFIQSIGRLYELLYLIEPLYRFMNIEASIQDPPDPKTVTFPLKHGIEIQNITFRYQGLEKKIFDDFSMFIPSGKIIALIAPNGAGKTTLVKLLCRLYDPEAGTIRLDGTDIRDMSLGELRKEIAILFQTPVTYQLSIHENIAFGDIQVEHTREEIEAAAKKAGAHDFIVKLPHGYDTLVGNLFSQHDLSVGQWQRLALARAFLRDAHIFILDEPTSAMDVWAETEWLSSLHDVTQGRTTILITHRLSTAMRADLIYVMFDNQIVEIGSHDNLLEQDGTYAHLWHQQKRPNASPIQ